MTAMELIGGIAGVALVTGMAYVLIGYAYDKGFTDGYACGKNERKEVA